MMDMPIVENADISGQEPRAKIVLRSAEFRRQREEGWRELDILVVRVERRGIRSLSADELQRLPVLYRALVSSLSVARSIALDRNMLFYLENLALRSFLVVYGPRSTLLQGFKTFFSHSFPRVVRSAGPHILIVFLIFFAGVGAGFVLTLGDESWFNTFVPAELAGGRGPDSTREDLLTQEIFAGWNGFEHAIAVFANALFRHNTMVGILSFALGMAAGIPTMLLEMYNGMVLGAFLALHHNRDLTIEILGWLSIHGVTEITAFILFGAGGLMLAEKILFPGRYTRMQNLALHGRAAAQLAIGAVLMLFIAAILEGVFRQYVQSTSLRFIIGWGIGFCWLAYFLLAGRSKDEKQ